MSTQSNSTTLTDVICAAEAVWRYQVVGFTLSYASHAIGFERGRYRVRGADGTEAGAFATFATASRAGLV